MISYVLFVGVIPPYKRGFYCDDETIRYPFKPNTVSVPVLLSVNIIVPFLFVETYEYLIIRQNSKFYTPKHSPRHQPISLTRHFLTVTTGINVEFMLGLIVEIALMHFAKSSFGVLRPHFIDVCRPNFTMIDCSKNQGYVLEPFCTSTPTTYSERQLKMARESFPSGHSSSVTYALCFLLYYVYYRRKKLNRTQDKLTRFLTNLSYIVLFMFVAWSFVVYVTRVTDYWHHKTDVVGGITLGCFVATILFWRKDSALFKSNDSF